MSNPVVERQLARLKAIAVKPGYKERSRVQMLSWAMGRAYHDPVNDECCPDFSCCFPDMFTTDSDERWRQYRGKYRRASPQQPGQGK